MIRLVFIYFSFFFFYLYKFLFCSSIKKIERISPLHKFVARGYCVFLAFLVAKYYVPFWLAGTIMLKVLFSLR